MPARARTTLSTVAFSLCSFVRGDSFLQLKSIYEIDKSKKNGVLSLESVRSFLAFDIDSDAVRKRLTDVQTSLVKTGADLKPVEPENIHITMRFLGNVSENTVEKIFGSMQKLNFTPFDVKIHGVGAFPDVRYPRVVWAGITEGANDLRQIFSQLEPHLQALGFPPDPKGFSPHLTIARVRSGRNKAELAKFVTDSKDFQFGIVRAKCFRLKKSELTPRGPIYSTLREFCPPG
jgi:2'-5' RNA ligase